MNLRSSFSVLLVAALAACGGDARRGAAPSTPAAASRDDVPATSQSVAAGAPAVAPAPTGHPRNDLIPRAVLFGNPERTPPQVSPDGKWLAFGAPAKGVINVFVAPIDDLSKGVQVTFDEHRPVREYSWSPDGKYVIYEQDAAGDENFHIYRVRPDGTDALDLTPRKDIRAIMVETSYRRPGIALIAMNDRDPEYHDVYEIEIATGKAKRVFENPGYADFSADEDLQLRIARQFQPDGSAKLLVRGKRGWVEHDAIPQDDELTTTVVGFHPNGKQYYLFDSRGRDSAALVLVDVATKKRTLLLASDRADAVGTMVDPLTGAVRAVSFNRARPEWKALDKKVAGDLAALAKLDDGDFLVLSVSQDDRTWIVGYSGDRQPTRFWKWDRKAKQGTPLYAARPALEGLPLARMHAIEIPARDGLALVSYLSLPLAADPEQDGTPSSSVPMVLLVHGGPYARDTWGYHALTQLLTNRGYAVLRVNYRGSTGFGKAFVNAGDKEWGKKMHDDLLDGVAWAVERGLTRADQVCIMGASYGGYATLAGLTLTPKTFACGVDIVGPSNLITLVQSVPSYWKPMITVFKTRMGDWTTPEGAAALAAVSPLTHVGKIERPLLIGQGANDPRVKQAESDQIVKAMQDKGLPVSYVLFPDEGHGFQRPPNMQAFMAVAEAFLSAHLGGAYQPMVASDFEGSTIQIKAGADGIPGLPAGVGR